MSDEPEAIYRRPEDYDLEHVGDSSDIEFFVQLTREARPARVLELACGSGRVTVPLAHAGRTDGWHVTGLELVPEMLEAARKRASDAGHLPLTLVQGDMREWRAEEPFDLILSPCGSMSHLLTHEDQAAAWRRAWENLKPGGRLAVHVNSPDLTAYGESMRSPARQWMEVDLDTLDKKTGIRMIRYKTTRYDIATQTASIRYLYDKYMPDGSDERSISDYDAYIYHPRELELLFRYTGFEVERSMGNYRGAPIDNRSESLIVVGVRPGG